MATDTKNPALVLGMFETGLGVVRSLGQAGVKVYGFDCKKDIGFYSGYVTATVCPHPIHQETEFIASLVAFAGKFPVKPVLFITSDIFLQAVSRNRQALQPHFLFNLPSEELITTIGDKYLQFKLAEQVGIAVPATFILDSREQSEKAKAGLPYPVFIKAVDVNEWRKIVGGSVKGFVAKDQDSFTRLIMPLMDKGLKIIVQEIIRGPDTNHFKYCAYSVPGEGALCEFTLQKIRQNPIRFGVGAVVESIKDDALMAVGRKLFELIGYQGVGSAEFKLDERDGQLKLIEINPRYWQQNYLSTACGVNFPLVDYLSLTLQHPAKITTWKTGVKWVNRYMDFDSFLQYRREKEITFRQWRKSLRGPKVYSDFTWDDMMPGGYETGFGLKFIKLPYYLFKKLFK